MGICLCAALGAKNLRAQSLKFGGLPIGICFCAALGAKNLRAQSLNLEVSQLGSDCAQP